MSTEFPARLANAGAFWSRNQECSWDSKGALPGAPPRPVDSALGLESGQRHTKEITSQATYGPFPKENGASGKRALHSQVAAGQPQGACWVRAGPGPAGAPLEREVQELRLRMFTANHPLPRCQVWNPMGHKSQALWAAVGGASKAKAQCSWERCQENARAQRKATPRPRGPGNLP